MTTSIPLFESLQNHQNQKMGMGHLRCFNDKGTAPAEFTMPVVRGDSPQAIVDLPASQPASLSSSDHGFFGSLFDKDTSELGSDSSAITRGDYRVILGLAQDMRKLQGRLNPSDAEFGYVDKITEDMPAVFGGEVGDIDALREAIRNYDPADDNTLLEEQIKQAFNYASTSDARRLLAISPYLFEDPSKIALVSRHMRDYVPDVPDGLLDDYAKDQSMKVHLDPAIIDSIASDDIPNQSTYPSHFTMEDYARALPPSGDVNDMGDPNSYRDFDDFDLWDEDTPDTKPQADTGESDVVADGIDDDYGYDADADDDYNYDDDDYDGDGDGDDYEDWLAYDYDSDDDYGEEDD